MKTYGPLLMRFSFLWFFFILIFPAPGKAEFSHTVKAGESLFRIAKRFQVAVSQLQEANGLRDEKIYPGQRLVIPAAPPKAGINPTVREAARRGSWETGAEDQSKPAEMARDPIQGKGFLLDEKDQQLLVRVAGGFLGLKYSRGGSTPNGLDCSAFVQKVFRIFGIDLPRTAREQFQVGYKVAREALQIGDLVFFKRSKTPRPTHVGIYIGDGRFIHTSLRKRRVHIDHLDSRYFAARFSGAKRIEEVKRSPESEEWIRNPALPGE
jgi:cell wall-associated NlpC family hydrolase